MKGSISNLLLGLPSILAKALNRLRLASQRPVAVLPWQQLKGYLEASRFTLHQQYVPIKLRRMIKRAESFMIYGKDGYQYHDKGNSEREKKREVPAPRRK